MSEENQKKPGNGEDGEGSPKFNLDLPDLFYDIICNFFPGAIAIALYLPRLVVATYREINASHSAIASILLVIAAWIIGITLNVATAASTFLVLRVLKRGERSKLGDKWANKYNDSWILKYWPESERRLLTKAQAQIAFFRVMCFISLGTLVCRPSDYYRQKLAEKFFDGTRLQWLYEQYLHYYWPSVSMALIFFVCWRGLFTVLDLHRLENDKRAKHRGS